MTRQCLRLCIYLCIHLLLQCVPHPYLASHGDYDNALFRIARRAGLSWFPNRGPHKTWTPQSGTWHSDQLLGHVQSQMRFNYTAQQYITRALSVYLNPSTLLQARPLMTRLQLYGTIDMPRMTWVAAHGWSVRHHPLLWFLENQLPAVDTEANATRALQAGHLDALLRCTSQPQAYNQGPQPAANCSLVLHPSSPAPLVLQWFLAPTSTRPSPQLCAVHAAGSEGAAARPPAFTPDMPEGTSNKTRSSCRPRAALFGAQRRRPRLKWHNVMTAALFWLLPHQPLLRLLPAVAETHWLLFLVLGLEGWAACYSDLLSLYGDAKSIAVTALDLWRRGVRQPLPLLGHLAAHHALVATFFATVYAWAALALSGPLLGVGWAIHTWVPKTWVTGVTLDLVYLAWLLGVRRLRPVVSQVLLGAMVQLRQWTMQPDAIHARVVIGGRVNPQEAANALRVLADRMEYLHAAPPVQELWHSARRAPVKVLGTHWPSPLRVPPGLDLGECQVPRGFLCPITQDIMALPAMLIASSIETPATYDKEAIQEWLRHARTDPRSRQPLSEDAQLVPNLELYRSLEDWMEAAVVQQQRGRQAHQQQQQQQQQRDGQASQQQQQQQQEAIADLPSGSRARRPSPVAAAAGAGAGPGAGQGVPPAAEAPGHLEQGHQQRQQQQGRRGSIGGLLLGRWLPSGARRSSRSPGAPQAAAQAGQFQHHPGAGRHLEEAAAGVEGAAGVGGPWQGLQRLSASTEEEGSQPGTPSAGTPSSSAPSSRHTGGGGRRRQVRSRRQDLQQQQQQQEEGEEGMLGQHPQQQQQPGSPSTSVSLSSVAAAAAAAARRAGSAVAAAVGGQRRRRQQQPPLPAISSDDEGEVVGPRRQAVAAAVPAAGAGVSAAAAEGIQAVTGRYNLRRRAASAPPAQ